jgi:hypothetical protein
METFVIYDLANGNVQFEGEAYDADAAWQAFRSDLGYSEDVVGVCERAAYVIDTKSELDSLGQDVNPYRNS